LLNACLPPHRPSHYNLTIRTDLAAHTFSGVGDIALHVPQPTPFIVLHAAAPLQLHAAVLVEDVALGLATKRRKATQIEVDEKKERVQLYFDGGLQKGTYRLALRWGGKLDGSMKG
jgi:aminopeptidase 2